MTDYITRIRRSLGHPPPERITVSTDVWDALRDELPRHSAPQVTAGRWPKIYNIPVRPDDTLPAGTI